MKNKLVKYYFWCFIAVLLLSFISKLVKGYKMDTWQITEFLINYEGGFVRRGLLGEFLLVLYRSIGLDPYLTILIGCTVSYTLLILFYVLSFQKKGYSLFLLPFTFFLGNPIINNFWVRKDVIIVLIFILTLYFTLKESKVSLVLVNLLLIVGFLITENMGFFTYPILILVLNERNHREGSRFTLRSIVSSVAQLMPSVLVFCSVLYFKGSQLVADKIWDSWQTVPFPFPSKPGIIAPAAIDGISWSFSDGLNMMLNTLGNFNDSIYAPIAWILILAILYFILSNANQLQFKIFRRVSFNAFDKSLLSNVLIFQLLTVMTLFILGWDYGRWVFYWVTTSFAIIVLVPKKLLAGMFPTFFTVWSQKLNGFLDRCLSTSKSFLLLLSLILGIPAYSWFLSSFVETSSIYVILGTLSKCYMRFCLY